ncbi:MAG: transpeptidase family protein [Deltaproteobacteria bacterium]|nr:transpeptidase family protein [Deltaproteobacteria bacterium]
MAYLRFRILVVFFLGAFLFLIILGRALQLQLLPNPRLAELSKRQHRSAITLYPKRGTIYDRNLNELAVSRRVGSIFANPKGIRAKRLVARELSRLTGKSYDGIYKKIKSRRAFVWIDRLVADAVVERLKKRHLEGVGILYEYQRFYTNEEMAGQVLGMVGIDSKGMEGVEYFYNQKLEGQKKSVALMRDAMGRPITTDETLFMETREGDPLILTLDKTLQFSLERELEKTVETYEAKQGIAIIQKSATGEILAMAHYPFFNPNRFRSYEQDAWKNRAITDAFEPGSTFKVFLSALALEEGISPKEQFFCENGLYRVNSKDVIREAERHQFQWLTFENILKYSSNIGAAKIAFSLGKLPFYRKILEFGFGSRTGIDLPGEAQGQVRAERSWEKIDLSNIAFGQGISVTAIQLVSAMSAIANGGNLMKPLLTKQDPQVIRSILSPRIATQLTHMLIRTTEKDGTGFLATLKDYKVAGKTGTAQKPNLEARGYHTDRYLASFLGFFPAEVSADTPRYTILVMLDEPRKYHYASQVAAPLFRVAALHTLRVFPPESKIAKSNHQNVSSVPQTVKDSGISPLVEFSKEEFSAHQMPDLTGRSLREVLQFSSEVGLNLKVYGSGIVINQSIEPGKEIKAGQTCIITFKAPSQ